jgi:transcriptional regulator with XRE-family HTH domain
MKAGYVDILPLPSRRAVTDLGRNLRIARLRRRLTVASMAERCGISVATYGRMEKGDPNVAIGAWATALFVLGDASALGQILSPPLDEVGMALTESQLPKRIRGPRRKHDLAEPTFPNMREVFAGQGPVDVTHQRDDDAT